MLDCLAPMRGLNRLSDGTQDFRPRLLSVAPVGAVLGWIGPLSSRAETSSVTAHERGRSRLHLASSPRRVVCLGDRRVGRLHPHEFRSAAAGGGARSTRSLGNGSGQECPLYTVSLLLRLGLFASGGGRGRSGRLLRRVSPGRGRFFPGGSCALRVRLRWRR